jgi:hypothetical protein
MNRIVEYYSKDHAGTRALDNANRSGIMLWKNVACVIDAKHLWPIRRKLSKEVSGLY